MVTLSKTDFHCTNCGYVYRDVSVFYVKLAKKLHCPACSSTNHWQRVEKGFESKNQLWKSLLVAMDPLKWQAKNGELKMDPKYARAKAYSAELRKEKKHKDSILIDNLVR